MKTTMPQTKRECVVPLGRESAAHAGSGRLRPCGNAELQRVSGRRAVALCEPLKRKRTLHWLGSEKTPELWTEVVLSLELLYLQVLLKTKYQGLK